MAKNPNRLLHGMGHPRLPSQAMVAGSGASPTAKRTPTGLKKDGSGTTIGPSAKRQTISVNIVDAFYQMLPSPDIQQIAIQSENRFEWFDVSVTDGLTIYQIATRPQQVYIWTDLTFYAMVPGDGMSSPPGQLDMHQLSGLLRFELEIDNTSPMRLTTYTESPYDDPNYPRPGGPQSGWATLDRDFGATRYGSAFALYARSQQVTRISMKAVQRTRPPRFVIQKIGFEIHGYVASEADFDEVWRKTIGG